MAKKFDFKRIGIKVAGVGAGAVVGKIADKPLQNMNPKIRSIIKIGVGAILPELAPKSQFIGDMGSGVLAIGAADLYDSFTSPTTVEGLGSPDDVALGTTEDYLITEESMNGTDENDVLNGLGENDFEEN